MLIGVESEPVKRGKGIGFWQRLSINKLTTVHLMVGGDLFRLLGEFERFAPVAWTSLYFTVSGKSHETSEIITQCMKCIKNGLEEEEYSEIGREII